MNILCDKCFHCEHYKKNKEKINSWEGFCKQFKIKRMDESESCRRFNFSEDAKENFKIKAERIEKGGIRESERFE